MRLNGISQNHRPSLGYILLVLTGISLTVAGCHSSPEAKQDAELSASGKKMTAIIKQSGGNWDKILPDDRQYIVQNLSGGDEKSGRMLFEAEAGRLHTSRPPSGPPRAMGR